MEFDCKLSLIFLTTCLMSSSMILAVESASRAVDLGSIISELDKKVFSYQARKEKEYIPPFHWYEKEGLFKSDIRVNTFGSPIAQEFRDGALSAVYDNDMFSTGWILTAILEAELFGKGAFPDSSKVSQAVRAISSYNDRNQKNAAKTFVRTFWPQSFNKTTNLWQQQPINIRNLVLYFDVLPVEEIEKVLKFFKLERLIALLDDLKNGGLKLIDVFSIPPDYDDTYLNMGLGATIYRMPQRQYKSLYSEWAQQNADVDGLIEATVKYSYEPFSADTSKNTIDTRTYFFARGFVEEAAKNNQPVSLITTWVQSIDEQRSLYDKRVSMPFNMNNVDVTVGANSVYGIAAGAIFNLNGFGDAFLKSPKMIQTYLNTTRFITWAIQTNFTARPDLAQVYYPSRYNFLWYASRHLFLIDTELTKQSAPGFFLNSQSGTKLRDVLLEAKGYLQYTFENEVTAFLFRSVVNETSAHGQTYFRDFLGLNDTDVFDNPVSNDVDALFSTAQAINILLATWTYQNNFWLHWKPYTPIEVRNLVSTSVDWLSANILNSRLRPLNAFFSGSVKGVDDLPFWYPANFVQYLNGTTVVNPDSVPESDLDFIINGVSGLFDSAKFQQELKKKHYGRDVPLDFHGYNTKGNEFPFWSSEPYTYAVAMLALSQYDNIR